MASKYTKGGGESCAVHQCLNNRRKLHMWKQSVCDEHDKPHKDCPCLQPFSLHRIPKDEGKRKEWIRALNRKSPPKNIFICSKHFVDGYPSPTHPSPTLLLGYEPERRSLLTRRRKPPTRRLGLPCQTESTTNNSSSTVTTSTSTERMEGSPGVILADSAESALDIRDTPNPGYVDAAAQWEDPSLYDHSYPSVKRTVDTSTTCSQTVSAITKDTGTVCELYGGALSTTCIATDADSMHYVGIGKDAFFTLVSVLENDNPQVTFGMSVGDQILLTLMRVKHNYILEDLARRLKISVSLVSNIFNTWVPLLARVLSQLVVWLPRETIRACLPTSFNRYPKTTCIIDCAETFIQRPHNLRRRAQTYSNYKGHNTLKYLVAIAPHGQIMFISRSYGGRSSDVFITEDCKILDYLRPGDEVMADRGFTIDQLLFPRQVKLNIPAFLKGRNQLSEEDVTETRRIAHVRIHVERAIRRLKVFKMLSDTVAVASLTHFDDILVICAGLVNLKPDLIRDKTAT